MKLQIYKKRTKKNLLFQFFSLKYCLQLTDKADLDAQHLNKRTNHMLKLIDNQLLWQTANAHTNGGSGSRGARRSAVQTGITGKDCVKFGDLTQSDRRKQVTSKFYTLLVLKKLQKIDVKQDVPFGEIYITRLANPPSQPLTS